MQWILKTFALAVLVAFGTGTVDARPQNWDCPETCWAESAKVSSRGQVSWVLDLSTPVNWEVLRGSPGWKQFGVGPPLTYDLIPNPHRDPRLGSFSRDPITLHYWWE